MHPFRLVHLNDDPDLATGLGDGPLRRVAKQGVPAGPVQIDTIPFEPGSDLSGYSLLLVHDAQFRKALRAGMAAGKGWRDALAAAGVEVKVRPDCRALLFSTQGASGVDIRPQVPDLYVL